MENEKQQLNPTESMALISEMIGQTRFNVKQGSFHFIFWGILLALIGIGNYVFIQLGYQDRAWYLWLLTFPGFFVSLIYGIRTGKKAKVSTYADGIFAAIWVSFGIMMFTAMFFLSFKGVQGVLFSSIAMLLAGYATFLSGWIIKFTPLKIGGLSFLVFSWIIYMTGSDLSLLLSSVAVIIGYVIPGVLLRNRG